MLGLKNIHAVIGLITLFLAYLLTIAPAGYFRAWVAKKMGDETGEDMGFMTLNPLVHIDMWGVLCLVLLSQPEYFSGLGWGKFIPINPNNIHGRYRSVKVACAFFSDTFAHFWLAALALIGLALLFGANITMFAESSSLSTVIMQLIVAFVKLNVALALVRFVINAMLLTVFTFADGTVTSMPYLYYVILLAPLLILLLFGNELHRLIIHALLAIQQLVA